MQKESRGGFLHEKAQRKSHSILNLPFTPALSCLLFTSSFRLTFLSRISFLSQVHALVNRPDFPKVAKAPIKKEHDIYHVPSRELLCFWKGFMYNPALRTMYKTKMYQLTWYLKPPHALPCYHIDFLTVLSLWRSRQTCSVLVFFLKNNSPVNPVRQFYEQLLWQLCAARPGLTMRVRRAAHL